LILFSLIGLLKGLSVTISETRLISREELRSYECGFESVGLSRVPFSLRYFFLTLVFLLFDLEVVFLILFPFVFFLINSLYRFFIIIGFICFLFLALCYEWYDGSLDWVI